MNVFHLSFFIFSFWEKKSSLWRDWGNIICFVQNKLCVVDAVMLPRFPLQGLPQLQRSTLRQAIFLGWPHSETDVWRNIKALSSKQSSDYSVEAILALELPLGLAGIAVGLDSVVDFPPILILCSSLYRCWTQGYSLTNTLHSLSELVSQWTWPVIIIFKKSK